MLDSRRFTGLLLRRRMKTAFIKIASAALLAFSGTGGASAQYIYTTNLYPVADATIRSDAPDSNFGGATFVMAGSSNSGAIVSRGLFKFDLSSIPTNATVSNATLTLVDVNSAGSGYFGLNRLLTNWDESEVTWNRRTASMPWTAPGGQTGTDIFVYSSSYLLFQPAPGTTEQFTNVGFFPNAGMLYDTQLWIDHPEQNFGWIWFDFNEASDTNLVEVWSRENPGNQPVLTIGYVLAFAPPVLKVAPSTNGEFCFTFNIEPNHGYQICRSGDPGGTNWQVIEVLDPPPVAQEAECCYPFAKTNTFYRVRYE
jgi:hypothetical protein